MFTRSHDSSPQCNNLDSDIYAALSHKEISQSKDLHKKPNHRKSGRKLKPLSDLGRKGVFENMETKAAITKEKMNRSHCTEKLEDKKKNRLGKMFVASVEGANM